MSPPGYVGIVGNKPQERAAEARRAKLELIREQVLSGVLVIRQMTPAERKKWARQHASVEAKLTSAAHQRRQAALRGRRKSEARLLELEGLAQPFGSPASGPSGDAPETGTRDA